MSSSTHQKALRYRLLPTSEQEALFGQWAGARWWTLKHFLARRIAHYTATGKTVSYHEMAGELTQLKRQPELAWLVVGSYPRPKARLPGGGGAPEIAAHCRQTDVVMARSKRSFVERVDVITSFGFGTGGDHRERLGLKTLGPALVITDLCVMRPDPVTKELTVTALHPGITREQVEANTGWAVRFAAELGESELPTERELAVLRDLQARTARAHGTIST